ncbi:MFS transporter [Burkholderia gladioli pv. gladioli]|uniref:MFS transporter n=1 Tax=Burkholderia gladioli TaxID=28095 RepID=UPI0012FDE14F|nr:MFS transporter [Burkholderia gladioli]MDJ1164243.1 MFS transporter [Burkholderia gladioli pv. gladioli]QPQ84135.1 MFS transporter [Burkholderia gladioli]
MPGNDLRNGWFRAASELRGGWRMLLGATWGVAVGAASLPFYSAGVFAVSLRAEYGWSLSMMSLPILGATLSVSMFAPLAGSIIDRFGLIAPAILGHLALALSFVALGMMPGDFSAFLFVSVLAAVFGLTSSPIGYSRAINGRFKTMRGLALGITLSGTGIAALTVPSFVAAIIGIWGRQAAYLALAAIIVTSLPFITLLLQEPGSAMSRLEEYPHAPHAPVRPNAIPTVMSIIRDRRFVRLYCAFFLQALGVTGFVLHLVPMLNEAGLPLGRAATIQGQMGLAIIAGRLLIGVCVDRFFAPYVAATVLAITLGGFMLFGLAGAPMALPLAFALGFALGAEVDLIGYLTGRYFGLGAYGRTYGLLYGGFTLATGLSPLIIAQVQHISGNYQTALSVCATFLIGALLLLATAPGFPQHSDKSR